MRFSRVDRYVGKNKKQGQVLANYTGRTIAENTLHRFAGDILDFDHELLTLSLTLNVFSSNPVENNTLRFIT